MVDECELHHMTKRLSEITSKAEAIMEYVECIMDKKHAEARRTSTLVRFMGEADHDSDTYMHKMEQVRTEGANDVIEIETYMDMLIHKFGPDLRTEAWNEHNTWTKNSTDVLQDQARWHARHGVVPKQFTSQLKRSQSEPNIPFNNCGSSAHIYF